ncbi:MAG: AAC(3) family N-acetyltransferase [Candidatus Accumulibacter sp.]|jgi:aminoglycoside 3-N-acetyltransferase|nr:AAC(3) family N-acetyltransferase [Accumulibacter sp.]
MQNEVLFHSNRGGVSSSKMLEKLKRIQAGECDVLYIHTDMTFGLPAKGIRRGDLLASLLRIIEELRVATLVFPTFTFSFCNDEAYDVQNSKTPMGALNEYVRKTGRGARTHDPLLSVYVLGDKLNLVDDLSEYSIGQDSNYDRLRNCGKNVKFLFFGADMRACFTYTHYAEAVLGVPYRYDRKFVGTVIDEDGRESKNRKAFLYSTYANCNLNPKFVVYDAMVKKRQLRSENVGDSALCCFDEKDSYETISRLLDTDIFCLTDGKFDTNLKDTTYRREGRIVSVR